MSARVIAEGCLRARRTDGRLAGSAWGPVEAGPWYVQLRDRRTVAVVDADAARYQLATAFTPATVGEVLRAAAEALRGHGWCQGIERHPHSGALDVLAALRLVVDGRTDTATLPALAGEAAVELRLYLGVHSVVDWQDTTGRTAEEVVGALFGAAGTWERAAAAGSAGA